MWMYEYILGAALCLVRFASSSSKGSSDAPVQGEDGPRVPNYGILNLVFPLDANSPFKLDQLDGMATGDISRPVIDEQRIRDGTCNLIDPICEAPVENLDQKRESVEGGGDPVISEAGGVRGLDGAEGGVMGCASVGGECSDGGGYSRQRTAVEDHTSRKERDDNEGFYDDGKNRRLCTIVSERLKEGGSRAHERKRLGCDVRGQPVGARECAADTQ